MGTFVALFRGINVGGNNLLPMKDLAKMLEAEGLEGVATYIQSGNVVFQASRGTAATLAKRIEDAVARRHRFRPRVLVLSAGDLAKAARKNPFCAEAESDPRCVHLYFLAKEPARAKLDALAELKTKREAFELEGRILYLHTPDGFGRSKLAARVEQRLGVEATARNWRTVTKVLEMTQA
jgi:uncharacterized protein (DUF1697 family)